MNDAYRLQLITIITTKFAPTIASVNVMIKNACITSKAPRLARNVDEFALSQLLFFSRGAIRIVILWSITLLCRIEWTVSLSTLIKLSRCSQNQNESWNFKLIVDNFKQI